MACPLLGAGLLSGKPESSRYIQYMFRRGNGIQYLRKAGVRNALQEGLQDFFGADPHMQRGRDMHLELRFAASGREQAGKGDHFPLLEG